LEKIAIDYIISYDGECGEKSYGKRLPKDLNCTRYVLNAGVSTQSTLLGRKSITFESLYVSNDIAKDVEHILPHQITLMESAI
jgi:DNA adenine methylase